MTLLFLAVTGPGYQTIYTACQKDRMKPEEGKR